MLPLVRELVCGSDYELLEDGWRNSTNIPQVTNCGQHTDFSTIPTFFLVIFSPVVFYELYKSRHSHLRSFSPISLRIILCCLLVVDLTATVIYDFYLRFSESPIYNAIHLYGDLVQYAGFCLALVLTIACRNRGIITSGVITLYWLLVVVCGVPELRYYLTGFIYKEYEVDPCRSTLYIAAFAFSGLELFLCCFADTPSNGYIGKNSCPEYTASFLNQLTFEWFSGLAYLGNKKSLEKEDLWDLNERDKAENLIPSFMANLKPRVEGYRRLIKKIRKRQFQKTIHLSYSQSSRPTNLLC
uniref:ABC transporter TMD0 domain-containing protein n=1 Tax=Caenorhabditis tropicalis TaxID=1561998 RepID=A0A1I7UPW9_9PELO